MATFWISRPGRTEEFRLPVSDETWARHYELPPRASRMDFWRRETGDPRFSLPYTAIVVEP